MTPQADLSTFGTLMNSNVPMRLTNILVDRFSYRGGYVSDYDGGRDGADFVRFAAQITRYVS